MLFPIFLFSSFVLFGLGWLVWVCLWLGDVGVFDLNQILGLGCRLFWFCGLFLCC